ncbi:epimerase [Paremcibacter congregatus]|uniref:Epimerase n=2 Tax=Paremcibacter congregatus TaxID=2043170 RepID=A0A2G4YQU4_9PROT|nr:epimerase [Paremcibacter congregatus]QDE27530.1 NAD(P)-dependent oxidoreductase [Paremcibacter congregatus]
MAVISDEKGLPFFIMTTAPQIAAVTGATGFVGKHLVRELVAQGIQVRALTRRPQEDNDNVTWVNGDLDNIAALESLISGADIVYHLAGLVKARTKQDFFRVNSESVTTLATLAEKSGKKPHFILLSSLAARERHLSSYAESKRQGEENLQQSAGEMPWTILRPPGIYGPEDTETLKIFKAVASRFAPIPGDPFNRASWVYAPDLVQAMIAVADNVKCQGKILDVDDGKDSGYSLRDLYETAAQELRVRPLRVTVPKIILKTIAYGNVLFSTLFRYTPMVTPEKVNELYHPDWICHGTHVMKLTNWNPETNLEKGFKATLKWYKDNNLI